MSFIVRAYEDQDLPEIAEIERISFSVPWSEEELARCAKLDNYRFFVVTEGDTAAGYAGILTCLDEADVTTVAVRPEFRRRGMAEALVKAMIEYADEKEIRFIFLEVRESNEPAKALYRKLGFEPVGRREDYYEAPREAAILMRLERRKVC